MKILVHNNSRGIALIIVMIVILALGVLAGGFAYSMKVETKLARNASFESDLEWLGKSGVELGRYVLCQTLQIYTEPWDSLNQKWAGGPMGTNDALAEINLEDNALGAGNFSVRIIDLERKFNVNNASEEVWFRALRQVGSDPNAVSTIYDSFLDWMDFDEDKHLSGAETRDYLQTPNAGYPPYMAKNGPLDDLSELLLIRGVTPEMFWGPGWQDRQFNLGASGASSSEHGPSGAPQFGGGLFDLFTTVSNGHININTAPAEVLQLIPGIDPSLGQAIVATRSGPDGIDGTEDDTPFRNPGEIINVPGMDRQLANAFRAYLTTRSDTFEIQVQARVGHYRRTYTAVVRRASQLDARILFAYWR